MKKLLSLSLALVLALSLVSCTNKTGNNGDIETPANNNGEVIPVNDDVDVNIETPVDNSGTEVPTNSTGNTTIAE